jgi:hypothetical protein
MKRSTQHLQSKETLVLKRTALPSEVRLSMSSTANTPQLMEPTSQEEKKEEVQDSDAVFLASLSSKEKIRLLKRLEVEFASFSFSIFRLVYNILTSYVILYLLNRRLSLQETSHRFMRYGYRSEGWRAYAIVAVPAVIVIATVAVVATVIQINANVNTITTGKSIIAGRRRRKGRRRKRSEKVRNGSTSMTGKRKNNIM